MKRSWRSCVVGLEVAVVGAAVSLSSGCGGRKAEDDILTQRQSAVVATTSAQLQVLTNSCGANQMQDFFQVTNTGSTSIALSDISIKFWANDTSGQVLVPHVWTGGCVTGVGGNPSCVHQVTGVTPVATSFSPACGTDPTHQANWEITIASTDNTALPPGASWSNIQSALNLANYSNFNPGTATWYSSCLTRTNYAPDSHFAVYLHGNLVFSNGITAPSCRAPHGSQQLSGYYGNQTDGSFPFVGTVPATTNVTLSIGLPVRDAAGLQSFIQKVSDPNNPTYRRYLTPSLFKQTYGATDADYSALMAWAQGVGFTINQTYSNNLLVTATGTAAQVERALFVNLVYRQVADGSQPQFVAVDREPSLDLQTRILWISGFDDYQMPQSAACNPSLPPLGGNSGGGLYMAADLRNAYLGPGSTCQALDGTNQTVGILALEPFTPSDVSGYVSAQTTGIAAVQPQIVPVASPGMNQDGESVLDIDMIMAMAPKANIVVFQGTTGIAGHADDILHRMATDGRLTVATNSYVFGRSDNSGQAISQMAAEGITFFTASGDYGNVGDPQDVMDMDNQTLVGGTFLNTGAVGAIPFYLSEGTWNQACPGIDLGTKGVTGTLQLIPGQGNGAKDITSGGIMDGDARQQCFCFPEPFCCGKGIPIPGYQDPTLMKPIADGGNGGSQQWRNYPDVSAAAYGVGAFWQGGLQFFSGTSAAAPLWAGFTALANQFAASNQVGNVGFANPVLYAIGATRGLAAGSDLYATSFNDVKDGVTNSDTSGLVGFPSVAGYDLATGWGSPTCGLIQQLGTFNPLAPQAYNLMEIHLVSGHDGVNDQSSVVLDVRGKNGTLLDSFTLKQQGEGGWSDTGSEHHLQRTLTNPLRPDDITGVVLHLLQNGQGGISGDNWDVEGIGVRLVGVHVPYACIADLSGNESCDGEQPSCRNGQLLDSHPGVVRLSETAGSSGQGSDAFFDTDPLSFTGGGCPKWGGRAASEPFTHLEFLFDTGGDDFRSGSELDVDVFDFSGNNVEHGVIHPVGDTIFDNDTEHRVLYQLHNQLSIGNIRNIQLTFIPETITCFFGICSHDEWHAQVIDVFGVRASSNWEHTCLFLGQEVDSATAEFNFKDDNRVQSFSKGSGCI